MMIDYYLAKDEVCEGFVMVCDMKGQTFSHLAQVSPFMLRKMLLYIQVLFDDNACAKLSSADTILACFGLSSTQ